MTLVRRETYWGHSYRLDGVTVKGVTTLLNGGYPKPQLVYWSAKVVAEFVAENPEQVDALREMGRDPMVKALAAVPDAFKKKKGATGTAVHGYAEQLLHDREVEVPPLERPYVESYLQWLEKFDPEVILTERPVASRKWKYAGTFDAIVRMFGEVWLLDWKTSNNVFGETACQLAAYRNAEFYLAEDGTEQPLPAIDRLGVVHVRPDGTDLYEVTDPEAAWKDFQHIAYVAKAKDRIDGQLVRLDAEGQVVA